MFHVRSVGKVCFRDVNADAKECAKDEVSRKVRRADQMASLYMHMVHGGLL